MSPTDHFELNLIQLGYVVRTRLSSTFAVGVLCSMTTSTVVLNATD